MAGYTDMDEDVPYRSIPTAPTPGDDLEIDDEEYSSLVQAQKVLDEGYAKLKFDLTEVDDKDEDDLKLEIRSRKRALEVLDPVKQVIDQAVEAVQLNRKGKVKK